MTSQSVRRPARAQLDLVAGEWREPTEALGGAIDDPNTGEPMQDQRATREDTVELALRAALSLHTTGSWADSPLEARIALLDDIAIGLAARVDELAYEDAMATGNGIRTTRQMASYIGPRVSSARRQLVEVGVADDLSQGGRPVRLLRRPLGPAAILAPWNAPTFVAVAKVASAVAAGCPVILKPSEWAPAGCQIVAEVVHESLLRTGLPTDVFQMVHGAAVVGSQLASDPRIRAISFTGGASGGHAVAIAAAPHLTALQLELGGHNPAIVLPDADIEATAAALIEGMTKLNGQWCEAPGKILVPANIHDDLVDALMVTMSSLAIGHCLDDSTDVGPMAYRLHRDRLQGAINELVAAGGSARTSSTLPDLGGWFLAPTLVTGLPVDRSLRELFGPVVTIHAVGSVEEAIRAANGPETGLAGFVFGSEPGEAMRVAALIPAGEVRINGCKLADLADASEQSFWNSAGIGGHGPTEMVRFFQGRQIIGVDDPALPI